MDQSQLNLPGKFFNATHPQRTNQQKVEEFWEDLENKSNGSTALPHRIVRRESNHYSSPSRVVHAPTSAPKKVIPPAIREGFRKGQIETSLYNKDTYKKPLASCEIIIASDGIFQVQNYKAYTIITQINDNGNAYLDKYLEDGRHIGLHLHSPKIPFKAMQIIYSFFFDIFEGKNKTKKESEAMTQVFYAPEGYSKEQLDAFEIEQSVQDGIIPVNENWFVFIPEQSITAASVDYKRSPRMEAFMTCVIDIHSHDSMGAFFSGTDNNDEKEPRFYGVLGSMPWSKIGNDGKRVICRYQTKINEKLMRHEVGIFNLFERPIIDSFNNPILTQFTGMINAGKLTDSEVIAFYSDVCGRAEIPGEILDRCKLELREFKGTVVPRNGSSNTARHRGQGKLTLEDYEEWAKYGFDPYEANDMPPHDPYDMIPTEHVQMGQGADLGSHYLDAITQSQELAYEEFFNLIMNHCGIEVILSFTGFMENQQMIQKLREDLREDAYALKKLLEENKIDENDFDSTFMELFEDHSVAISEAYREYNLENYEPIL